MYFDSIPDLSYATKPSKFPFAEGDFVRTKNFFRRYALNETAFNYAVFFRKYTIVDGDRLDLLAEKYYGDPFYDWVILITNNFINGVYDWPLTNETLEEEINKKYDNPDEIFFYRTKEVLAGYQVDGIDVVALEKDLVVGEEFYNNTYTFYNGLGQTTVDGNTISYPVTRWQYEQEENDKKRDIFILKERYLDVFVDQFRAGADYSKSSDFIDSRLKATSI